MVSGLKNLGAPGLVNGDAVFYLAGGWHTWYLLRRPWHLELGVVVLGDKMMREYGGLHSHGGTLRWMVYNGKYY
jgi:hypothetical protein